MELSWMYITIQLEALHSNPWLQTLLLQVLLKQQKTSENRTGVSSMKPVSLVLLITSVLLTTHIPLSICRPRDLSILDGHGYSTNRLDDVLLNRAGDHAMSNNLVGEKILQYLQRNLEPQKAGVLHFTHFPAIKVRSPDEDNSLEELVEFSKRNDDPPISIDLTFHLLRNMIEMARIENEREQAGLNRKYLDEVGK